MCTQVGHVSTSSPTELPARKLLVHNVARRLRISPRTVRHLAQIGELRGHKAGPKIWQFLPADVDEFRRRREGRYA